MSKLMYSCQEATQMVIKKEEEKLKFTEMVKLKMHLLMCGACKAFEKQTELINKILKNHQFKTKMPDAYKQEISKKIEEKL